MSFSTCLVLLMIAPAASSCTSGWTATNDIVDPSALITIRFALRPAKPNALDEALAAISDPQSPRFRQYLTHTEIAALVSPAEGAVKTVSDWIFAEVGGSVTMGQHGEYVFLSAPVANLQRAFANCTQGVSTYRHDELARSSVRLVAADPSATLASLVPAVLRMLVWAVLDLVELLPVPPKASLSTSGQPGDTIDPDVIHRQYNLTDAGSIGGRSATSQGVAAFEQAQFVPSDVAAFETHYKLPEVIVQVNGPNKGGYFGEAGLDTQYIVASGRGVPSWFIAQDAFDMLAWCEKVLNMTEPPSVLSISWGSGESGYKEDHMKAASSCFQKMGVQGISIFVASGDEGTGKQGLFSCNKFDTVWPASCPYVTAVGGTFLQLGTEQGWTGSGGGFSAVFPRLPFQEAAVKAYVASASLPFSNLYTASGRAVPDVAALATNYRVFSGGVSRGTLTGTSASTPTFAGMVSVINDLLVAAGKPTVGFVNPALYAAAAAGDHGFLGFDVTNGNNKHGGCTAGFPAASGWDPVTGLGTPQWSKLKAALRLSAGGSLFV